MNLTELLFVPARALSFAILCAASAPIGAAPAAGADFVFGEDFDGVPACTGDAFAVGATTAAQTGTLGTSHHYLVKVRACTGSGSVSLGVTGAPATWTVGLQPTLLSLASGAIGVALLEVSVPTNGDAGNVLLDLAATNGATTYHGSATLDIANEWVLHFAPDGTGSDTTKHVFPPSLTFKVGATIRLISDDTTTNHLVHADGGFGLVHQNTGGPGLAAGEEYDMTLTGATTGHIYCHSHPSAPINVTVQP